jgi:hypothetical protein
MLAGMDACPNCTAPREAGLVVCRFCQTPLVRDVQTEAVQCQQCSTYSDIRATNCVKCKAWVVVKCMFCGGLSPHHYPACVHCRELFSGAAERWQQRKEQYESAQRMQMVSSVGGVAAAFLGAAAGVALSNDSFGDVIAGKHHHHSHHHGGDDSSSSSWTDVFSSDSSDQQPGGDGGGIGGMDLSGGDDDT